MTTTPNYKHTLELVDTALRDVHPELYRAVVPRRYVPPPGYVNPKIYAPHLVTALYDWGNNGLREGQQVVEVVAIQLLKRAVPTYFVGEAFCRAVAATSPPDDMALSEIKLPMPAMLFMMPTRFMRELVPDADIPVVAVVVAKAGSHYPMVDGKLWPGRRAVVLDKDKFLIHLATYWDDPMYKAMPMDYIHTCTVTKPVRDIVQAQEFVTFENGHAEMVGMDKKAKEADACTKVNSLVIKILLALAARPELLEEGGCARPHRPGKAHAKHGKEELWNPNFVGRTYRARTESQGGEHASPRMHWRRGHMRGQRYGKGRELVKVIWIEPVLVNLQSEEVA